MKKNALRAGLALFIIGGSLSAAAPASAATVWVNFQDPSFVLTSGSSEGDQLSISHYAPLINYLWSFSPDASGMNFTHLASASGNLHLPPLVTGVSGNNMNNGTLVRSWHATGELNQTWKLERGFTDWQGARCYAIVNGNVQPNREIVMGVSGGVMASGTPIRIWDFLGHADQYWCAYQDDGNGNLVPQ
jgi:hypothetical protein